MRPVHVASQPPSPVAPSARERRAASPPLAQGTASTLMPTAPSHPTHPAGSAPAGTSEAASFARVFWRVAAADVSQGNRPVLLKDGAATFEAMLAVIAAVRHTVELEAYIFRGEGRDRRAVREGDDRRSPAWRARTAARGLGGRTRYAAADMEGAARGRRECPHLQPAGTAGLVWTPAARSPKAAGCRREGGDHRRHRHRPGVATRFGGTEAHAMARFRCTDQGTCCRGHGASLRRHVAARGGRWADTKRVAPHGTGGPQLVDRFRRHLAGPRGHRRGRAGSLSRVARAGNTGRRRTPAAVDCHRVLHPGVQRDGSAQGGGARRCRRARAGAGAQRPSVGQPLSRGASTRRCCETACASGNGRAR